ncbi:redoxin domain-containing protein [Candidatus Lucifugimonas marina]|uniref:Redoxin domain-containing protein n=1 Tax=Candidatus Lucifugimonas marina TaxID=3038979 RepID=A0AAJ5ZIZ7_9CHLR|nr:redoxin domain-containing protein [SAR202 cluster bacterium JH702]MDG0869050.1 redoxin domain-containing protein [SAR202 cluster bacterium JH639]WFG35670.1 redoxin domain-containing protein [SAR202 cluster bacterium JH545]WFG39617.1 redoxin domain-containing protein [SAR202 cluster bacterium JH1073]
MPIRLTTKSSPFVLFATSLLLAIVVSCAESEPADEVVMPTAEPKSAAGILPPTVTPTPPSNEFAIIGQPEQFQLEDLSLVGINSWINSDPLEISQLSADNKLVLLDFWTYTCVNCVRTFPYLKAWHQAYADLGLVIIGVHSPEFDFEKIPENIQDAVERYGIEYPVAVDSDKATWGKYGNHFWPSKYLITVAPSGESHVVLRHFGEGGYREFESVILAELNRLGQETDDLRTINPVSPERSENAHTITRELYGGYSKNYLSDGLYAGQDDYYIAADTLVGYVDDGTRRHGQFFLDGEWINGEDAVVSGAVRAGEASQFAFEFFATSVNSVLGSEAGPAELVVELDGKPLSRNQTGADITWREDGLSVVEVDEARLYQLVELPEFGKHELVLKTDSEGLAIYTVTFGVNEFGP